MSHETRYKLCIFYENCAMDTPLLGVYIPKFGKIFSVCRPIPYCYTDGGEIWHGGADQISLPIGAN